MLRKNYNGASFDADPSGAVADILSERDVAVALTQNGGVMWKYTIIVRASYQQGFAMPKMPQRGSGTRAATARKVGLNVRPDS